MTREIRVKFGLGARDYMEARYSPEEFRKTSMTLNLNQGKIAREKILSKTEVEVNKTSYDNT